MKIFKKNDFEKPFEVFKIKVEELLRNYNKDVTKTFKSFTKEFDGRSIGSELRKRVDFYQKRVFQLIDDMINILSKLFISNYNFIKKEEENRIRQYILRIIVSTKTSFINGLEEFLNSCGQPEQRIEIQKISESIKSKLNDKVNISLKSTIKEQVFLQGVNFKKEKKVKLNKILIYAILIFIGAIIGYLLKLLFP